MNYPQEYLDSMRELLGEDELSQLLCALDDEYFQGLRVNNKKISNEAFESLAAFGDLAEQCRLKKIPWIQNGYYISDNKPASSHPYYRAGLFYIQEPSAMTPARSIPIEPDDMVLDMCAAPGGKATQLASMLSDEGFLLANDISAGRGRALLKNLEMAGIDNFCVTAENPDHLASIYPGFFDKILIDAPCSGEGMFRKDPKSVAAWIEKGPKYYSVIQEKLLEDAAIMLKPGGYMLYSTCTFSLIENEMQILKLLENHPELSIEGISPYEGFSKGYLGLEDAVRIFPHKMNGEGHFCCLIKKKNSVNKEIFEANKRDKQTIKKLPETLRDFLSHVKYDFSKGCFISDKERIYYLNKNVSRIPSLRYLRTGLYIGDIKSERFEPSQAFAMALGREGFEYCIDYDSSDILLDKYLKGESLKLSNETKKSFPWRLITVEGYPLGWAKLSGDMLKNKYESSWRKN